MSSASLPTVAVALVESLVSSSGEFTLTSFCSVVVGDTAESMVAS